MLKICFVVPGLALGGAERSLVKFANRLVAKGYSISVVTLSGPAALVLAENLNSQVNVQHMNGRSSADPRLWFELARIIGQLEPDFVFGWSLFANLVVCLIGGFRHDYRIMISERVYLPDTLPGDTVWRKFKRMLIWTAIRRLYPVADVITANSRSNLSFIHSFLGDISEYQHLPNIINLDEVEELGRETIDDVPDQDGPRILSVGRLHHQKGFDVLLEAFVMVRSRRNWNLVIVGDGPEKGKLRRLSTQLGLSSAVHWVGSRSNPYPYYLWSDILVMASRYEGFPNVPLEAMALGRAVICCDCKTGPRELTDNGTYGELVPVEDPQALADRIIELGDSADRRESLGQAAREHIARHYGFSRIDTVISELFATKWP